MHYQNNSGGQEMTRYSIGTTCTIITGQKPLRHLPKICQAWGHYISCSSPLLPQSNVVMAFNNVLNSRVTGFQSFFKLNFSIRKTFFLMVKNRWVRTSSQPVNLPCLE